jgi:hypothetical protein|tara:strand:+ start:1523 stop:1717 length:195 start_codon:yes stop_codon:yes gene_type:complete
MKFGMYTRGASETAHHISLIEMPSLEQAEAYFAGRKQMTLAQFREIFLVREIKTSTKTLLYGNR